MGLFSKAICYICGSNCGMNRFFTKDKKWICSTCHKKIKLPPVTISTMTAESVALLIKEKQRSQQELEQITITKSFGSYIKFDEIHEKWYVPDGLFGATKSPIVYAFSDIIGYELIEDGNSIVKGTIGRALIGGALFGGVGAIVGSNTGKKKSKATCTKLQIKITLNNMAFPNVFISLISTETSKASALYQSAFRTAQDILSILQIICENNQSHKLSTSQPYDSPTDEIIKYKQLYDQGIITQDEFDAKKKELLGL